MRDEPSHTAEAVCLFRATDQRRPRDQRIVDDPYAKHFLGPLMRAGLATIEASGLLGRLAEEHAPGLITYVLCRHRFIDECLLRALDGPIEQVVILGAGYDTRAYRFAEALAGRRVFELDFPATSRRKATVVANRASAFPPTAVERVEIDFESESIDRALAATSFESGKLTFFIWEGVSMYLTRATVKETLAGLYDLGSAGSVLAMDIWYLVDSPDFVSTLYRMSPHVLHLLGEPIIFGLHPEDAVPFMERLGFEVVDLATRAELRRRFVGDDRHVYPGNYVIEARWRPLG